MNVKLTAIFFFVLAAVSTILALIICGKSWRLLAWAKEHRGQLAAIALAGMVAFFFVGWRPYMVNLIEHGTLVYPGKQDIGLYSQTITGGQIPPNLVDAGRGTRLAALFFGATADNGDVIYKIPGTFTRSELNVTPDGRNGGFGPLFGAEAVLSGLALIVALTRPQRRPGAAETAFFLFFVLCTALFPECWWARYVPMAWGIPLAAILLARSVRRDRIGEVLGAAVMLVAAANIVIAGNASISSAARFRHDYRGKLKAMIHSADPIYLSRGAMTATGRLAADELWQERLREHGQTNVIFLERDDCVPMIPLSADMVRCKPPAVNSAHE